MSQITLMDKAEWYNAIAAMVERGITFKAYVENNYYIIELTGGY